jgi:OOP family OmpA-OmpF porin
LQQSLESVQAQYSDLLESFDGNAEPFEGARPLLEGCLQQQFQGSRPPGRLSPAVTAIAVAAMLGLGVWLFLGIRDRGRWNAYLASLRSEPGIVVVSSARQGGKYTVSGLRDPLARDPAGLLPQHQLAAGAVVGHWELYQALHPTLVLARARQLLAPPAAVTLQLQDGVLVGNGNAPVDWIESSVRLAPVIPGVARFDASRLVAAAFDPLAAAIEAAMPMFVKGSTSFAPGGEQVVQEQVGRLAALDVLGRAAQRRFAVELVGEADADGAPEANLPLSEHRAARVLAMLQLQRLERVTLSARGIGSRTAADPSADEANKQRNRRVSFRVGGADVRR